MHLSRPVAMLALHVLAGVGLLPCDVALDRARVSQQILANLPGSITVC